MSSDIAGNLTAARRVADHCHVVQIQALYELGEIVGVLIHVVTVPRLSRAAVAAAIVSNDAEASLAQEQHLSIPRICAEWPTVRERYDWP